jgi:hypothetical protein
MKSVTIPGDERKSTLNQRLLEQIFAPVANGIQVLHPVREKKTIIDFHCMLPGINSSHDGHDGHGASLLAGNNDLKKSDLFAKLVHTIETGNSFDEVYHHEERGHHTWFRIRAEKFDDVVCKEPGTRNNELRTQDI